jgi:hypothetical protein
LSRRKFRTTGLEIGCGGWAHHGCASWCPIRAACCAPTRTTCRWMRRGYECWLHPRKRCAIRPATDRVSFAISSSAPPRFKRIPNGHSVESRRRWRADLTKSPVASSSRVGRPVARLGAHRIRRAESRKRSGQLDQIPVILGPMVFGAVGKQHDPLRIERFGGAWVVCHQHYRTGVAAQRVEHLLA